MSKEITHSFQLFCEPSVIVTSLTEGKHIQNWWTKDATVTFGKGIFHWKEYDWTVELFLENSKDNRTVSWKCVKSNMQNTNAWEDSTILFELVPNEHGTRLNLKHFNYKNSPCYDICNEGWAFTIGKSLKSYLETGKGMPYAPN